MKIIKPSIKIEPIDTNVILSNIEKAGRTCYKSEAKITKDSAEKFIKMIINRGHESVLEHEKITVRIICDRGVSHELVRHRVASYSQESTRYVNYKEGIEVIKPCFWSDEMKEGAEHGLTYIDNKYVYWLACMEEAEQDYKYLIELGATPQEARTVLPNSLKTEIVVTANIREWRHILKLRCSKANHPQMREIMLMILKEFKILLPVVFSDIESSEVSKF